MNENLPNLERIEEYLYGDMLPQEKERLEKELSENPALREEFDLVKDMVLGAELFGDEQLKMQLGQVRQELKQEGFFEKKSTPVVRLQPAGRQHWYRWAAAASLVVLAGAALLWWMQKADPYQQFYQQNFQAEVAKIDPAIDDAAAPGLLPTDQERKKSLTTSLKAYQSKSYESAQTALSAHLRQYPQDTVARFYLGLSELHLSHFEEAARVLQAIAPETLNPIQPAGQSFQGTDFQYEIIWYLALAYARVPGQAARDATLSLLHKLAAGGDAVYAPKARAALQLLE